jgi:hypothetical protein
MKVSIWVSLQSIEICGIVWKRAKIQKNKKCSMSNRVMYIIMLRKVRMSVVTVHKVTRSNKEVKGYKTVQYICRTWVKRVLERVPCTVNKHSGKCTAVYSTNRQSEYETNVERYHGPAKVYKVTSYRLVKNVCKKRMEMNEWYMSYGTRLKGNHRNEVNGRNNRMVMVAMYARYIKEVKRFPGNKAKASSVRNYRKKTRNVSLKVRNGMYSSSTVALEKLNVKRYKYIAGTQVCKCCIMSGSINVYIVEKAGGNRHREPVLGKRTKKV